MIPHRLAITPAVKTATRRQNIARENEYLPGEDCRRGDIVQARFNNVKFSKCPESMGLFRYLAKTRLGTPRYGAQDTSQEATQRAACRSVSRVLERAMYTLHTGCTSRFGIRRCKRHSPFALADANGFAIADTCM